MKKTTIALLLGSHIGVGVLGFALGIYALPILIAPPAPSIEDVAQVRQETLFTGTFVKDLEGSDALHWGEGDIAISANAVSFMGSLSPGPDYKLYLSPKFVETEAEFEAARGSMVRIGDVRTFENFIVPISKGVDPSAYTTVIVWCETFGEFISAASYQ